jgi:hypothetical protein
LLKHQVETPPSITTERPDAPPMLLNICEKMMSKDPNDRYQTAGDVGERLTEWLADRGQQVGDNNRRSSDSGGSVGVGSDVFRRFAASISRTGSDSGSSIHRDSSLNVPSSVKSGLGTKAEEADEDIGLAPLEEEVEPEEETFDSSDSDSGDGSASEEELAEQEPLKSLFEETLEKEAIAEEKVARFITQPGEINPLRPEGYTPQKSGPSPLLFVGIGVGVIIVVVILFFAFGGS